MEATATEMKNNFGQYLETVMQQDLDVIVTRNGKKVARLTPYSRDVDPYFTVREHALDYNIGCNKVSYEEFNSMNESSTQRMEYINGEIIRMSSPGVKHQMAINRLSYLFQSWFMGKSCQPFFAPFDVHLKKKGFKDFDVVQPDLLVICDLESSVNEKDRYIGTPTLVVEILSDATRTRDMVDKLNSYRLSGVMEYWVVDTKYKKVMVYEFKEAEIEQFMLYDSGKCKSFYFEGLEIEVGGVFR